jgi:hypothetical protein
LSKTASNILDNFVTYTSLFVLYENPEGHHYELLSSIQNLFMIDYENILENDKSYTLEPDLSYKNCSVLREKQIMVIGKPIFTFLVLR